MLGQRPADDGADGAVLRLSSRLDLVSKPVGDDCGNLRHGSAYRQPISAAMTALASPELYEHHGVQVPGIDGYAATRLELRLSGTAQLRAGIEDDVALLEAARLGAPVRLIVNGYVAAKGFTLKRGTEADAVTFAAAVRVETVEAAELA